MRRSEERARIDIGLDKSWKGPMGVYENVGRETGATGVHA